MTTPILTSPTTNVCCTSRLCVRSQRDMQAALFSLRPCPSSAGPFCIIPLFLSKFVPRPPAAAIVTYYWNNARKTHGSMTTALWRALVVSMNREANQWMHAVTSALCDSTVMWIYFKPIHSNPLFLKVKNGGAIALNGSPFQRYGRSVTWCMGSHNVTCHPTQVNVPQLNHSQTGWNSVYLPRRNRRAHLGVAYLPKWSTHPSTN